MTPPKIALEQQIKEIELVISESDSAFARMVSNHKMRSSERDWRMNRLYAIKRTLEWTAANRDAIAAAVKDRKIAHPEAAV